MPKYLITNDKMITGMFEECNTLYQATQRFNDFLLKGLKGALIESHGNRYVVRLYNFTETICPSWDNVENLLNAYGIHKTSSSR